MRFLVAACASLVVAVTIPVAAQSWYVDVWDRTRGLSSNLIYDVIEDRTGTIWAGSDDGLYRMDGHRLTPLNEILNDPAIPVKYEAGNLYVDDENRIWIATRRSGLFCYDQARGQFRHIRNRLIGKAHVPGSRVYGLHQDDDGYLIISMHQVGLGRYFEEQDSFELIVPFTDQNALTAQRQFQLMLSPVKDYYSRPERHWYSTLTSLVRYVPAQDTFLYFHPPEYPYEAGIRSATMDHEGIIWMSTYSSGNWSFDPATGIWKNYRVVPGPDSYHNALNSADLQVFDEDNILVATDHGGLLLLSRHTGKFTPVQLSVEGAGQKIQAFKISRDSRENLWISGYSGLHCYAPGKQQFGKVQRDGFFVDARRATAGGTLYLTDHYNQIHVLPPGEEEYVVALPDDPATDDGTVGMVFDSRSQAWVITSYSVMQYHEQGRQVRTLHPQLRYDIPDTFGYIRAYQIDSADVLWVGTQSGVIMSFDLYGSGVKVYDIDGPANLKYAYWTEPHLCDHNGNVWFIGHGGIFFFDQVRKQFSNSPEIFKTQFGEAIEQTFSMALSAEGRVFASAQLSGVYSVAAGPLENATAVHDTPASAMPSYETNDMLFDRRDRLWLAADEGVAFRDLEGQYHFFGEADGITGVNSLILDVDGTILAPAAGGFYHFHPNSITIYPSPYNIVLRQFNVFDELYLDEKGTPVQMGDTAILTHQENFFSFTFDDASYRSRNKKQYAYILEGLDDQWIESGVRNYAAYTHIPTGAYTFKVKARIQDTKKWSAPAELLRIKILPPVWKTWWFIVLCIALSAALAYAAYRYRMQQLQSKNALIIAFNKQLAETELKALRAQMNPHFLFNVLNAIKLNVQKNEQDKAIDFITDFSKLIRSVLQNSGQKRITLQEELEALELYIKIEQKRFNTEFQYNIDTDGVHTGSVMIPPLLLQPYVENAIWHGLMHKTDGQGRLLISASDNGDGTVIRIRDNGIGRRQAGLLKSKSATTRKSMGMQITSDRMQLSEQEITVELVDLYDGERAAGTEVVVRLG